MVLNKKITTFQDENSLGLIVKALLEVVYLAMPDITPKVSTEKRLYLQMLLNLEWLHKHKVIKLMKFFFPSSSLFPTPFPPSIFQLTSFPLSYIFLPPLPFPHTSSFLLFSDSFNKIKMIKDYIRVRNRCVCYNTNKKVCFMSGFESQTSETNNTSTCSNCFEMS